MTNVNERPALPAPRAREPVVIDVPDVAPAAHASPARDLLAVLVRRWRTIVWTMVVVTALAGLYCLVATPYYEGTATVMIDARPPQLLLGQQRIGEEQDALNGAKYDYYQTQFVLLMSPSLAQRVIEEMDLAHDPRFLGPGTEPGSLGAGDVLIKYLKLLTIEPVRGTRLVTVAFRSRDAKLAADVANTHARIFVHRGVERLDQASEQVRTFLQAKLLDLRSRMEAAELRLTRYQRDHEVLPTDLAENVSRDRFTDLSRRLTAAEAERIALAQQHRLIRQGRFDGVPVVSGNGLIQRLRGDLNKLEVDHAWMGARFRSTYPPLQQIDEQLASARASLKAQIDKIAAGIDASYAAARRTVHDLRGRVAAERRTLVSMRPTESELIRLTADAETTRALHDNVLGRIKELDVAGGAEASNISIVDPATEQPWPAYPAVLFDLALALFTGLVLGTGLAFLRDSLETAVRDPKELHRATGVETLAIVPDFDAVAGPARQRLRRGATRARIAAAHGLRLLASPVKGLPAPSNGGPPRLHGGSGPHGEAFRTLRTALLLRAGDVEPRVVVVSSAVAREGKTTTAVNAARTLAGCGMTVLLIDGDLRVPRCHDELDRPLVPGLGDALVGAMAETPIHPTAYPNLFVLPAGSTVDEPTAVLSSARLRTILAEARARFDYVVIDSPPVLGVSDGLLLASVADGVLLVTEHGRTAAGSVQLAVERFRRSGAVVLGAVLNRGELDRDYYRYGDARPAATPPRPAAEVA